MQVSHNPFASSILALFARAHAANRSGVAPASGQPGAALTSIDSDGDADASPSSQTLPAGVSSPSAPAGAATAAPSSFLKDLTALLNAIGTGDSTTAQSAGGALKADVQKVFGAQTSSSSGGTSSSPFVTDINALISAAQSGNTGQAQQAAGKVAGDIQSALQALGGHDRMHHADNDSQASQAASASTGAPTASDPDGDGDPGPTTAATNASNASPLQSAITAYQLLNSFASGMTAAA